MTSCPALRSALALCFVLAAAAPAAAQPGSQSAPAVARPTYHHGGELQSHSTVFFLALPQDVPADDVGFVAVGAAHSFDLEKLGQAGEVRFMLPGSGTQVSVASRYLAKPGKPFRLPGGTLRGDFIVFALDLAPSGVRILDPAVGKLPRAGERVRILGIPNVGRSDQTELRGTLVEVSNERIEVDLDAPEDLRGWGGAPVVAEGSGRVLGILEGAWPIGGTYRLGIAPIDGVLDALKTPLAKGLGQPFSHYENYAWELTPPKGNPFDREAEEDDGVPDPKRMRPVPVASSNRTTTAAASRPSPPRRYVDQGVGESELRLAVEYPGEEAVVGNRAGAFLAGRAMAVHGEFKKFDVIFVIDTSGSTHEPTGHDVDGDGRVGKLPLGPVGGIFGLGMTDPGDSVLAAEILAARQLLLGLDPRSTRVGLVTFAGESAHDPQPGVFRIGGGRRQPAITEEPLTRDYELVDAALKRVFQRGPSGLTHMAAGVDQATIELLGLQGSLSEVDPEAEKIVLFFTDGQPTLPYDHLERANVEAVFRAAERARRGGLRIHSFALGQEALAGPVAVVEMAERTDGFFTPVRDPGDLVQVVEVVKFTEIESVELTNRTTGDVAEQVQLNVDGSWTALVPLEVGRNEIEVTARADDGRVARQKVTLQHAPGEADPEVPRELVSKKNRLLERKLLELRRGRIAVEREAAEAARKELLVEIQRERAKAAAEAERQRKELELDVEGAP